MSKSGTSNKPPISRWNRGWRKKTPPGSLFEGSRQSRKLQSRGKLGKKINRINKGPPNQQGSTKSTRVHQINKGHWRIMDQQPSKSSWSCSCYSGWRCSTRNSGSFIFCAVCILNIYIQQKWSWFQGAQGATTSHEEYVGGPLRGRTPQKVHGAGDSTWSETLPVVFCVGW